MNSKTFIVVSRSGFLFRLFSVFLGCFFSPPGFAQSWNQLDLSPYGSGFTQVAGESTTAVFFSKVSGSQILKFDGTSLSSTSVPAGVTNIGDLHGNLALFNGTKLSVLEYDGLNWNELAVPASTTSFSGSHLWSADSNSLVIGIAGGDRRLIFDNGAWNYLFVNLLSPYYDLWGADSSHYYYTGNSTASGSDVVHYRYKDLTGWHTVIVSDLDNLPILFVYGIPNGTSPGEIYGVNATKIFHWVDGSGVVEMSHPFSAASGYQYWGIVPVDGIPHIYGQDGLGNAIILELQGGAWADVSPSVSIGMNGIQEMWGISGNLYVAADNEIWYYGTPIGPPLPNFQLDVDVIQAVRDPSFFVTGKPIYARAYITCPTCTGPEDVDVEVTLDFGGTFTSTASVRTITVDPAEDVAFLRQQNISANPLDQFIPGNYSFDFLVPFNEFETSSAILKDLTVTADLTAGGQTQSHSSNISLAISHVYPVNVGIVQVNPINDGVGGIGGFSGRVTDQDIANSMLFMDEVYPGVNYKFLGETYFNLINGEDGYFAGNRLTANLALLHTVNFAKSSLGDEYFDIDYLFGLWPQDAWLKPDADPYWAGLKLTGYVSHGGPGTTMSRMVGMNMGLGMPAWIPIDTLYQEGHCGLGVDNYRWLPGIHPYLWDRNSHWIGVDGYTGSAIRKNSFVNASSNQDFMSRCVPFDDDGHLVAGGDYPRDHNGLLKTDYHWVSDIHWNYLSTLLTTGNPLPPGKVFTTASYQIVSMRIHSNDTVAELKVIHVDSKNKLPRRIDAPDADNYCVRSVDAAGTQLDVQCFDLSFTDVNSKNLQISAQYVQVHLIDSPSVAEILITKGGSVEVLETMSVSAHPPNAPSGTIQAAINPVMRSTQSATDLTFCWTASDVDGDELTYTVIYSDDGWITPWLTLVTDWTDTCYTVDLATVPASNNGRFAVIASDGFYQSFRGGIGAVVVVPDQGPRIVLKHADLIGDLFVGESFLLSAMAYDLEDGSMDAADILWKDESGTLLGSGEALVTATATATAYTVFATDSQGNTNQKMVWLSAQGCGGITAVFADMTLAAGTDTSCQTSDSIVTRSNVTIEDTAILHLISPVVILDRGFTVQQGGTLTVNTP